MESMHFASQIQFAVCKINIVCHDCSETRTEDLSTNFEHSELGRWCGTAKTPHKQDHKQY